MSSRLVTEVISQIFDLSERGVLATGGEEVYIFNDLWMFGVCFAGDIKVHFYDSAWEAFAEFTSVDVHKNVSFPVSFRL